MSTARFGRLTDAPASFTLVGARVIDPSDGTDAVRDLVVREGRIAGASDPDGEIIEGRGLIVMPGLCDLHAHRRPPGGERAETLESGARAAAKGGYTTVCAMPNTDPALDSAEAVRAVAVEDAACRVRVIGAATHGRAGERPADLTGMAGAGAVGFSDDGASVPDGPMLREILSALEGLDRPLVEHAEDRGLAGASVMRSGPTATRLGLSAWPPEAEVRIVERDLELAVATGARLHLTHLSSAASLGAVRAAKSRGVRVTCDVTPHHLSLHDGWVAGARSFAWQDDDDERPELAFDGACRVNPPLAPRDDALALLAAVADGTVDAIATDHAPHPPERTLVPFEEASPGLIGLETALSLGLAAVAAGRLSLPTLVAAMTTRAATIIGEARSLAVGATADLVLVDPAARWRVTPDALASRSANTPLIGMELPGVVRLTVADGRVTYRS